MKKISMLFTIVAICFSCSSDDNNDPSTSGMYKLVKTERFDSNDLLTSTTTFEYNLNGDVYKITAMDDIGVYFEATINYNSANQAISQNIGNYQTTFSYANDLIVTASRTIGSITYVNAYTYNTDLKLSSYELLENGVSTGTYTFGYDNNNMTSYTYPSNEVITYSYDNMKNPYKLVFTGAYGKINLSASNVNNYVEEHVMGSSDFTLYTYTYNTQGYPINRMAFDANGDLSYTNIFTYDTIN